MNMQRFPFKDVASKPLQSIVTPMLTLAVHVNVIDRGFILRVLTVGLFYGFSLCQNIIDQILDHITKV